MQGGLTQKVYQEKPFSLTGRLGVRTLKSSSGQNECLNIGDSCKLWLMAHNQGKVIEEERIGSDQFALPIWTAWLWPSISGWRIKGIRCEAETQGGGEQMQVPTLANPV